MGQKFIGRYLFLIDEYTAQFPPPRFIVLEKVSFGSEIYGVKKMDFCLFYKGAWIECYLIHSCMLGIIIVHIKIEKNVVKCFLDSDSFCIG